MQPVPIETLKPGRRFTFAEGRYIVAQNTDVAPDPHSVRCIRADSPVIVNVATGSLVTPLPPLKIESMSAFIAEESDGDEGLTAFFTPEGWLPMVAADEDRVQSLMPMAQMIANQTGRAVTLVRFSVRENLTTLHPKLSTPPGGSGVETSTGSGPG